jgi:hypothetical protein
MRKKAAHELRELVILTAYLYVAFGVIIFYKYAVLRGEGIDWAPWGLAIIKALLVAKFILLARAAGIGERYRDKPLIWPTLYKSAIFLVVVGILTVIEEAMSHCFTGDQFWKPSQASGVAHLYNCLRHWCSCSSFSFPTSVLGLLER